MWKKINKEGLQIHKKIVKEILRFDTTLSLTAELPDTKFMRRYSVSAINKIETFIKKDSDYSFTIVFVIQRKLIRQSISRQHHDGIYEQRIDLLKKGITKHLVHRIPCMYDIWFKYSNEVKGELK